MDLLFVFVTAGNAEEARRMGLILVEEKLAACVNIVPTLESIYRWQDKVEQATEALLLIKASRATYPHLVARVRSLHSYACPEIVAVAPHEVEARYATWWENSLRVT